MKRNQVNAIERGEIFTPLHIVTEMLDNIPNEVWRQPHYKWLEPSCGKGIFIDEIYKRLIVYHSEDHIFTNMLYACEIWKPNVIATKQKFDKLNLYVGNTLEMSWDFKFDVVIGNPPFNQGGIRSWNGKHHGEENKTIWFPFVEKAFEWLNPNGLLVFITPASWLCKINKYHLYFCEKQIEWLKILGSQESNKIMKAAIPITLFIIQNKKNGDKTRIGQDTILLDPNESIPFGSFNIFNKLRNFIKKHNCPLEVETKLIWEAIGDKTPLPCDYCLEDKWAVDTITKKEGILVKKVETIHKDGDKRKLIIANKLSLYGAFIDDGKLSLCGKNKFYILGDNLELILKILNFKVMDMLVTNTKYNQSYINKEVFEFIPDLRKLGITDITEEEFYKLVRINF